MKWGNPGTGLFLASHLQEESLAEVFYALHQKLSQLWTWQSLIHSLLCSGCI